MIKWGINGCILYKHDHNLGRVDVESKLPFTAIFVFSDSNKYGKMEVLEILPGIRFNVICIKKV